MRNIFKAIAAAVTGLALFGGATALAEHRYDSRPDYCDLDHDHRSHAANYYDYYDADKYYRAGAYRSSGVVLSVRIGDNDRYDRRDRRGRYDRYDDGRRNGYRGKRGRLLNKEVYDTRYRARIVLTEELVRGRGGPRLVCTVAAKGPEARYVPRRRLNRIAHRECSPRARIRIYA